MAPGARQREPLAFDSLYPRYLGVVLSYVRSRIGNDTDAEDITAETFEAALTSLHRFRGCGSPEAWLLAIARQQVSRWARRARRRFREVPVADLTERERETLGRLLAADTRRLSEDEALRREAVRVVRRLLAGLPEQQREALLLRFEHRMSAEEIGDVMGRSVAAVNSLLQRARATILQEGESYFRD